MVSGGKMSTERTGNPNMHRQLRSTRRTDHMTDGAIPIRHSDETQEKDRLQKIAKDVIRVMTSSEEILLSMFTLFWLSRSYREAGQRG